MSGGLPFSLSFVEHLSCLIIWPELTQDVEGSSACPLLPKITKTCTFIDQFWSCYSTSFWVVWPACCSSKDPMYCMELDLTGPSAIVQGAAVEWCAVACNRTRGHSNRQMQMMSRLLNSHKTGLWTALYSWIHWPPFMTANLICHQNTAAVWKWHVCDCAHAGSAYLFCMCFIDVVFYYSIKKVKVITKSHCLFLHRGFPFSCK